VFLYMLSRFRPTARPLLLERISEVDNLPGLYVQYLLCFVLLTVILDIVVKFYHSVFKVLFPQFLTI
jgi:hypothetical protein